jgi:AcrR family transcriptional regulator
MPRSRSIPDAEILEAAARVIGRNGPLKLTLADVGREVGLAPATLLQRFGSKRGLLLALAAGAASDVVRTFGAARATAPDPLAALYEALFRMGSALGEPETLANHLAFLQLDLADPEFRVHAIAHADAVEREIRRLLEETIRAGDLPRLDARILARTVYLVYNGALLQWALRREGTFRAVLQPALDELLDWD